MCQSDFILFYSFVAYAVLFTCSWLYLAVKAEELRKRYGPINYERRKKNDS